MTRRKPYSEITEEMKSIIKFLDTLNEKIMEAHRNRGMTGLSKRAMDKVKVQHVLPRVPLVTDEDRKVPLEGVSQETFRMKNDTELDGPLIHYGPYANELTRSRNLIALALEATSIYEAGITSPRRRKAGHSLPTN